MASQALVFDEGTESVTSDPVESTIEQSSRLPTVTTRKNSITGTLNKITDKATSFGLRRRRPTGLTPSSSSLSLTPLLANERYPSRLPTPISTTSSSRNLAPRAIQSQDENINPAIPHALSERPTRQISEKFSQLPFFRYENSRRESRASAPSLPRRNSSTRIEHRGLMAPIQPSSLPRSTTLNDISEIRYLHSSLNYTTITANHPQGLIASATVPTVPFASGPATRSNLRPPTSSSRRPYLKSPAPQVVATSSKLSPQFSSGLPNRSNLRSPTSYRQTGRRPYVKSPAPQTMVYPTRSSSRLLGRKERFTLRSPGPTPSIVPASNSSSAPRQALPSQLRMLPRSTLNSPTTRLPTPTAKLYTPEYAHPDEDARDKRAQYLETKSNGSNGSVVLKKASSFSTISDTSDLMPLIRSISRDPRPVTPPPPHPAPNPPPSPPSPPSPPPPPPPTPEPLPNSNTAPLLRAVRFIIPPHNLLPDDAQLVYQAQPARYWLARHETLSSFLRTAALNGAPFPHPFPPPPGRPLPPLPLLSSLRARASRGRRDVSGPAMAGNVTPAMTQAERDRLIFGQLRARCVTEEARESLEGFIGEWVRRRVVVEEAPVPVVAEEERSGFWGWRH